MSSPSETSRRFFLAFHRWATLSIAQPARQQTHTQLPRGRRYLHARRYHRSPSTPLNQCPVRYQSQDAIIASTDQNDSKEGNIVSSNGSHNRRSPITTRARRWDLSQIGERPGGTNERQSSLEIENGESQEDGALQSYRSTLSGLANPVVLLTTWDVEAARTDPDGSKMENRWHGVTLGSFTSLCLEPRPHVTFNIKVDSRTLAALRRQKTPRICIHILSASQEAAEVASTFAKPYERSEEPFEALSKKGVRIGLAQGAPFLQWRKITKAWLWCSSEGDCVVKTVGDHHICVFRVDMMDKPRVPLKTLGYCQGEYVKTYPLETDVESNTRTSKKELNGAQHMDAAAIALDSGAEFREAVTKRSRNIDGARSRGTKSRTRRSAGTDAKSSSIDEQSRSAAIKSAEREARMTATSAPTFGAETAATITRRVPSSAPASGVSLTDGAPNAVARQSVMRMRPPPTISRFQAFSTSRITHQSPIEDRNDGQPEIRHPLATTETARDFLCHEVNHYRKRFKRLVMMNEDILQDRADLDGRKAAGTIGSAEIRKTEEILASRQRFVTRQLALHAAVDLARMLDEGHVSRSRVQYIESCIEQGQAALLEEGRDLMQRIDKGGATVETKIVNRGRLLSEEQTLRTALHRLQDYASDEDSDFYDD